MKSFRFLGVSTAALLVAILVIVLAVVLGSFVFLSQSNTTTASQISTQSSSNISSSAVLSTSNKITCTATNVTYVDITTVSGTASYTTVINTFRFAGTNSSTTNTVGATYFLDLRNWPFVNGAVVSVRGTATCTFVSP